MARPPVPSYPPAVCNRAVQFPEVLKTTVNKSLSENRLGEGDSPILLPGHRKIGTVPDGSRIGYKKNTVHQPVANDGGTANLGILSGNVGRVNDGSDLVVGPAPHEIVKRLKADPYRKLQNSDSGVDYGSDSESHPAHQGFSVLKGATAGQFKSDVALGQGNAAALTPALLKDSVNRRNLQSIPTATQTMSWSIDIPSPADAWDAFVGGVTAVGKTVDQVVGPIFRPIVGNSSAVGDAPESRMLDANQFTKATQGRVNKVPLLYKGKNLTTDVVGQTDREITPTKMAAANGLNVHTGITPGKMEAANGVGVGILRSYTPAGMEAANKGGFNRAISIDHLANGTKMESCTRSFTGNSIFPSAGSKRAASVSVSIWRSMAVSAFVWNFAALKLVAPSPSAR